MKKKLMVLVLCIGMLSGMTANAQSFETLQDSNTAIYSDSIAPNTLGVCFVVKKGGSIEDNESVYMLTNSYSDSKGNIEFEFNMLEMKNGESTDGEYDIYIKEDNGQVKKGELVYTSLPSRTAFFNELKSVTGYGELKSILENEDNVLILKSLGCKMNLYTSDTAEIMCDITESFDGISQKEFSDSYNRASAISGMEDADKENADEILNILNPEFEDVEYSGITDDKLKDWLVSYLGGKTFSDEKYVLANILYKFNNSVSDKIDDLLDDYAEILGIENKSAYEDYLDLKNKAKANIEISEILGKNPAESAGDILDAVEKAVEEVSGSKKSTSSGGGGGGSSSKTNGYATGVPSASEQPKEDTEKNKSFADMKSAEWAEEAVSALATAKIVNGDENGNFRPNDPVTREEFVKMLVLASGKYNENAVCDFSDVPGEAWFYSYVASAYENGVANGVSENSFGAGQLLTRQDMTVLCARAKSDIGKVREEVAFSDSGEIADYAKDAVSKLYMAGVVNGMGDNTFAPHGQATRAQCAQMIYNLFLR